MWHDGASRRREDAKSRGRGRALSRRRAAARVVGSVGLAVILIWAAASSHALTYDEQLLPSNPLAGLELFLSKGCVKCHAVLGHGGAAAPDFGKIQLNESILGIATLMWNHSPRMTEEFRKIRRKRPTFTSDEMSNLVGFLYLLNFFDPEGDPSAGSRVFAERRCKTCHTLGGQGGEVGPPLDFLKNYYSPIYLATDMWNHGVTMTEEMRERNVPLPRFTGSDVADLLAYIRQVAITPKIERYYLKPGSPVRGALLARSKGCGNCHTIHGQEITGAPLEHGPPAQPLGKGKTPSTSGPDLGTLRLRTNYSGIAGKLWNHGEVVWHEMVQRNQAIPSFTPEEMGDLTLYLYFMSYVDRAGDTTSGREVFVEKGCILCHRAGRGDQDVKEGPDLSKTTRNASPFKILAAMWNHLPAMEARLEELQFPWPRFRDREMADLITYLQSIK